MKEDERAKEEIEYMRMLLEARNIINDLIKKTRYPKGLKDEPTD